jgi:hypothetical protein
MLRWPGKGSKIDGVHGGCSAKTSRSPMGLLRRIFEWCHGSTCLYETTTRLRKAGGGDNGVLAFTTALRACPDGPYLV